MRAHAVNIAAQLWLLRDNGGIDIDDGITVFTQHAHDLFEKQQAVRAEKAVVSVGKQLADIAQRGRAEQCVGNRVQQDIRVGMTEQPLFIGNRLAAEDQLAVLRKFMYVVSVTDSHSFLLFAGSSLRSVFQNALRDDDVDRRGELDVFAAALNDGDLTAHALDQRAVVGEV